MVKKILGNLPIGLPFVLSAPAGTGKTTLVNMLEKKHPCVRQSLSFTTRPKRQKEKQGIDYQFISIEEFKKLNTQQAFLEQVSLYGHYYGTSKAALEKQLQDGYHVFLVIDTQGALALKDKGFRATYLFLAPPSIQELEKRLKNRETECPHSLSKRLALAQEEMQKAHQYDYYLVNDNLDNTLQVLESIIITKEYENLTQLKKEGKLPWHDFQNT